jgi:hypothetical protein
MPRVIAAQNTPRYEALLLAGGLVAAALTFHPSGATAPLVVAAATLALGASRRLPGSLSLAAASATAAAFVHFAVAPEHFAEWWGFGTFFVLCGEVQLGWALLLRRRPGKAVFSIGLAGSLLLVALWALSRTSGLPLGPEPGVPEAVGTPDVLAIVLELVTAASCAWALTGRRATSSKLARPLALGAMALTAAAAAFALLSIG